MLSSMAKCGDKDQKNGYFRDNEADRIAEDVDIASGYYIHSKKLGQGGIGSVWLATHLKTNQKVIIKVTNKTICRQSLSGDLHRVYIEIKALKALNHENIAKLYQVIETKENIYLILEYCNGGQLFDYSASEYRLTEEEARITFRDLIKTLDFIHTNGFAHRSLKPENILFDKNRNIKLIDFGLSAHCSESNKLFDLKTCCGSPAYAAPEIFEEMTYSGPPVDVWSAGVLLYALLVGRLPFDDQNRPKLHQKIQYESLNHLSKEAQKLIACMLQTDPIQRITIKKILNDPWLRVNDVKPQLSAEYQLSEDEALNICCDRFPGVSLEELKLNIRDGFGYQTATYWLILKNSNYFRPLTIKCDLIPNQRRRSKSLSSIANRTDNSPKIFGAKRLLKIDWDSLNEYEMKGSTNQSEATEPLLSRDLLGNESNHCSTIPLKASSEQSPKVKDSLRLTRAEEQNKGATTAPKNARVLAPNNSNTNSPLRAFGRSFTSERLIIANKKTPKKVHFRGVLANSAPAKSQAPRVIARGSANHKNITLTQFNDPQQCIDKLLDILRVRGVQCTQKSKYCLRCFMWTMDTIILEFTLEICKFENKCVIHRKRLKGDAWDYKRICEAINQISYPSKQ